MTRLGNSKAHDDYITTPVPASIGDGGECCAPAQPGEACYAQSFRSLVFSWKTTSERPYCADCECPMILSHLEPDKPGFDLRTYACLMCAATESIIVAIS
ncbi:MAG: hypothetical protein ACXV4B_09385 [Halobacteriota archaeon]